MRGKNWKPYIIFHYRFDSTVQNHAGWEGLENRAVGVFGQEAERDSRPVVQCAVWAFYI